MQKLQFSEGDGVDIQLFKWIHNTLQTVCFMPGQLCNQYITPTVL